MDRSSSASRACRLSTLVLTGIGLLLLATRVGAQAPSNAARSVRRAIAPSTERRTLAAVRAASAPTIDGRLDDAAWSAASVGRDFVQRAPDVMQPATQRTEVRILFDDAALYVAMRMSDSAADSIVAPLARRTADPFSDCAELSIDGYLDRRTAFRFMINPSGVQRDALVSGDDLFTEDIGWDAVWASATRRDSAGWTAELRDRKSTRLNSSHSQISYAVFCLKKKKKKKTKNSTTKKEKNNMSKKKGSRRLT